MSQLTPLLVGLRAQGGQLTHREVQLLGLPTFVGSDDPGGQLTGYLGDDLRGYLPILNPPFHPELCNRWPLNLSWEPPPPGHRALWLFPHLSPLPCHLPKKSAPVVSKAKLFYWPYLIQYNRKPVT